MTYTTGGLIQVADYNKFVQGGDAVNHNIANVNTIWGTGFGDKGYGQTGTLATVPAGDLVTATQWATLIARINSIRTHQTGSNTGLVAPVAGSTIAYINTLQTFVDTVYANRFITGIQGTDSPASTTTHVWNSAAPTTFQIVRTFTFPDPDAARYFFNAGGLLGLSFNAIDSIANLKGANWVAFLNNKIASFFIAAKSSARSGSGASVTSQQPNIGYWGLTTTDTTLLELASGTGVSAYDSNTVSIKARTNGVQGSNGDNGTVITVTMDFNDIAIDSGLGRDLNLSVAVNSTARRPETTALPTAIAYPSLVPVTYAITPNVTSINEGGSVTFTVSAPAAPNGTVLKIRLNPASTITSSDFLNGAFASTVTINSGTATFNAALVNDAITEGTETFSAQIFSGGAPDPTPVTVLATSSTISVIDTSAGPFNFTPTISFNTNSYDLKTAAIAAGWNQVSPLNANVTIANGVIVGASSTNAYAFDTGTGFPAGTTLRLNIGTGAYVVGAGGAGGQGGYYGSSNSFYVPGGNGGVGGPALRAQTAITIANLGTIGGGGGGGGGGVGGAGPSGGGSGGGGGGGGRGFVAGGGGAAGGSYYNVPAGDGLGGVGTAGTVSAGGIGGSGSGNGSQPGANGASTLGTAGETAPNGNPYGFAQGGAGGAAGIAVTGTSNITWAPVGTILGPTDAFVFSPTISTTTTNYNLRASAVAAGWNQTTPLLATVTISNGVVVGATSTGAYAFDTGIGFPAGTTLRLNIGTGAYVVGAGGGGGQGGDSVSVGTNPGRAGGGGGPALRAQAAITVTNSGTIGGGGGGGGGGGSGRGVAGNSGRPGSAGGGGGGGAGYLIGEGGFAGAGNGTPGGTSGSLTTGGTGGAPERTVYLPGGAGGNGGALGNAGSTGSISVESSSPDGGSAGAGGAAVVGNANITWTVTGTRLGALA